MTKYKLVFSPLAQKDAKKLEKSHLKDKCKKLLEIIAHDPFCSSPSYEKLQGDLQGFFSRRINIQHRLVYTVDSKLRIIKVFRMWTHYE